jgi:hypothetical protein
MMQIIKRNCSFAYEIIFNLIRTFLRGFFLQKMVEF